MSEPGTNVEKVKETHNPEKQLAIIQESLEHQQTFFEKLSPEIQDRLQENFLYRLSEKNNGGTYLEHRENLQRKDQMIFGLNVLATRFAKFPPFLLATQKWLQPGIGANDVEEVINALRGSGVKADIFDSLSAEAQKRGLTGFENETDINRGNLVTVRVINRQPTFSILRAETTNQPCSPEDLLINLLHDMSAYLMEYTNCYGEPDPRGFFSREDRQFAATMLSSDALLDTIYELLHPPNAAQP